MANGKRVVIVGAGHNGLVAAGYLARAGLDVEVLERRDVVGGAAVTEEWFPGYRISTCSYICHILQKKVIDDLELRRYGFYVYEMDPARIVPFPNGNVVRMWHDDGRTADEIREFSPHDADAWSEWAEFWDRAVRILSDYYLTPPPSLAELSERFRQDGEEELLETLLTVPLRDLIDRFFESDEVRAMVGTGSLDMGDTSAPGSAYITALYRYAAYRSDTENYGIVRGGMGGITQSMKRSAEANGVSIRTGAEVRRILTEGERTIGVELADGEVVTADLVVSNADPKRTFLQLLSDADLDEEFIEDVQVPQDRVRVRQAPLLDERAPGLFELPGLRTRSQDAGDDRALLICGRSREDMERCQERPDHRCPDYSGPDTIGIRHDGSPGRASRAVDVGLLPPVARRGRLLVRESPAVW